MAVTHASAVIHMAALAIGASRVSESGKAGSGQDDCDDGFHEFSLGVAALKPGRRSGFSTASVRSSTRPPGQAHPRNDPR